MIIISQNKETIINFDNVESIDIVVDLDGTGKTSHKIYYVTSSTREELGIYATEERAKEVLQEIKNAYSVTQLIMLPTFDFEKPIKAGELAKIIAYEMPKE